ncbi:MAG: pyridoxal phosphate-dependent aminotransferase [Steroidobacterales bacterium]
MSTDLTLPRLSRRHALIGAAALLAPLPRFALASPGAAAEKSGLIKLDGNENPYGPSPAAREAIVASAGAAPRYADETIETLTNQLAAHEGVPVSQIVIGTGSGEILRMAGLLAATTTPGSGLVASRPTYEELPVFAERLGIKVRWVAPDAGHRHDLAAMRTAITDLTRLVYVCNPNNPTGAAVKLDALESFIRSVPANCTVIVDEAYMDLVDEPGVGTAAGLVKSVANMIVLRTFSKIHGLAGLRIGYGITPEALSKRFNALSLTWPNSTGLAAATASFNDHAFLKTTRAALVGDRNRVHAALDRMGLKHTDAQGNFVFFDTGGPLKQFQDRMLAQGIKVGRHFDGYDNWARVTIGVHREVDRFLAALPRAVAA